jgi:hypothetical protein
MRSSMQRDERDSISARLAQALTRAGSTSSPCTPSTATHAAERWAAFPVLAAQWGLDTGNEAVMEHARNQLEALAAAGP